MQKNKTCNKKKYLFLYIHNNDISLWKLLMKICKNEFNKSNVYKIFVNKYI